MAIETLHHGQLAMPPGGDAAARAFYGGVLGIAEIAKPPHPANRGGCLFESGQVRVHLGVEQDHRPARKAHPALQVDDPAALSARLEAAGGAVRCGAPLPGYDRLYVDDDVVGATYGEAVAAELGFPPQRVFKTLISVVDDAPVVAIVPVATRLSEKLLAAAVGGKRSALAEPSEAERLTGYSPRTLIDLIGAATADLAA